MAAPTARRPRPWLLLLGCAAALCWQGRRAFCLSGSPAPRAGSLDERQGRAAGRRPTARSAAEVDAVATAASAAAASAPAISFVVASAALASSLQLSRVLATPGAPSAAGEEGFFGSARWEGRTLGIFLVWALFISYAFFLAPGQSPEAKELDLKLIQQVIASPFDGSVAPLFVSVFNSLGIWPMVYAATLLPGAAKQAPVPAWPFVASSFVLGAFGLSPYLALREYRGTGKAPAEDELDWVTRNLFEGQVLGKITALFLLASAVYLLLFGIGNGTLGAFVPGEAWAAFLPVFMGSLTPHVSCVDFMVLWMFYGPVLLEDGRRRGLFAGSLDSWPGSEKALFLACAAVPVFGGCTWLLLRPPLVQESRG